jgi:PEP-CTERM motif
VQLRNIGERFGIPILSGNRAPLVIRSFIVERDTSEYFPGVRSEDSKGEVMQPRGTLSVGLASIALLVSCALLEPAFASATTFDVSGEYSSGISGAGTFSGTLTIGGDYTTAVDITFPIVSDFTYISNSLPSGNNWELTANNIDGQELDLTFSTIPTPGSLVGMTGGTIVSGQVVDIKSGGFPLFQGFSGTISTGLSSAVPEPSSLALLALGFLACLPIGFARGRARRATLH